MPWLQWRWAQAPGLGAGRAALRASDQGRLESSVLLTSGVNRGRGNWKGLGPGCTAAEARGLLDRDAAKSLGTGSSSSPSPRGQLCPGLTQGEVAERGAQPGPAALSPSAEGLGHARRGSLKRAGGSRVSPPAALILQSEALCGGRVVRRRPMFSQERSTEDHGVSAWRVLGALRTGWAWEILAVEVCELRLQHASRGCLWEDPCAEWKVSSGFLSSLPARRRWPHMPRGPGTSPNAAIGIKAP